MKTTFSSEQRFFIDVLSATVNQSGSCPEIPEDLDWPHFYLLCRKQNLSGMIYFGLKNDFPSRSGAVRSRLEKDYDVSLFYDTKRDVEMKNVFRQFDSRKIPFLPLKGFVLRKFYPSPEWRTMGDVDILVRQESVQEAKSALEQEGFSLVTSTETNFCFKKPPFLTLELHYLFYHPYSRIFRAGFPDFYHNEQVWSRLIPPDSGFRYEADRLDLFLMFFLHLTKHFLSRGIGVRYLLDYKVLKDYLSFSLEEPEISLRLKELHLLEFARNIDRLSSVWFENGEADERTDKLADFILGNTVHGDQTDVPKMLLATFAGKEGKITRSARFRFVLSRLFPCKTGMRENYPILVRHSCLLPLCYFHWIFAHLSKIKSWGHYWRLLTSLGRLQRGEIDRTRQFQTEMGLENFENAPSPPIRPKF